MYWRVLKQFWSQPAGIEVWYQKLLAPNIRQVLFLLLFDYFKGGRILYNCVTNFQYMKLSFSEYQLESVENVPNTKPKWYLKSLERSKQIRTIPKRINWDISRKFCKNIKLTGSRVSSILKHFRVAVCLDTKATELNEDEKKWKTIFGIK